MEEETKPVWRRLESVGALALALTLLGLFVGQSAQQYAMLATAPAAETAQKQPRFNAIDYAATASIKGGTVIIGPCDTHRP